MKPRLLLSALLLVLVAGLPACLDGESPPPRGEDTTSVVPSSKTAGLRADGAIVIVRGNR